MAKKFYVVWRGRRPGIYTDWPTCQKQVSQFPGAKFKSFPSREEAEAALAGSGSSAGSKGDSDADDKKAPKTPRKGANKTFTADEVDAVPATTKIFTDGGCEPNPGNAGSGVAIYRDGQLKELWFGLFDANGTNNTAELNALHQALLLAEQELELGATVAIFCDSQYAIGCMTQWAAGWQKNGWTRKSGEIKNLELIKVMFEFFQRIASQIQVLHVNGHVGVEGNELADRMSILAMESRERAFVRYAKPIDLAAILATRSG